MAVAFDEHVKAVTCPRCGFVFNANDPRLAFLTPATREIWTHPGLERFRQGRAMALKEIAERVHLEKPTVHYHLRRLINAGLVECIPLRTGGKYNSYRGKTAHKC